MFIIIVYFLIGNYREKLSQYFGVTGIVGMNESSQDFLTRVITVWVNQGQRNIKNLEKVFAKMDEYALEG